MGGKAGGDDDYIVDINVTPFVDVVLVLLVVFMVTARMMTSPSVPLQLPKAATGEETKSSPLAIAIKRVNSQYLYFYNGRTITKEGLENKIESIGKEKKKKKPQAILAVDKRVHFGKVMWVLDLLRSHGIEDYAFNIDPSKE